MSTEPRLDERLFFRTERPVFQFQRPADEDLPLLNRKCGAILPKPVRSSYGEATGELGGGQSNGEQACWIDGIQVYFPRSSGRLFLNERSNSVGIETKTLESSGGFRPISISISALTNCETWSVVALNCPS
jgi:hypothetical protein